MKSKVPPKCFAVLPCVCLWAAIPPTRQNLCCQRTCLWFWGNLFPMENCWGQCTSFISKIMSKKMATVFCLCMACARQNILPEIIRLLWSQGQTGSNRNVSWSGWDLRWMEGLDSLHFWETLERFGSWCSRVCFHTCWDHIRCCNTPGIEELRTASWCKECVFLS